MQTNLIRACGQLDKMSNPYERTKWGKKTFKNHKLIMPQQTHNSSGYIPAQDFSGYFSGQETF
jgi:hypothetical protein